MTVQDRRRHPRGGVVLRGFLTIPQARATAQVDEATIRGLIDRREVNIIRWGEHVLLVARSLHKWLSAVTHNRASRATRGGNV